MEDILDKIQAQELYTDDRRQPCKCRAEYAIAAGKEPNHQDKGAGLNQLNLCHPI
jgi:hypothetical protein